MAKEHHFAAHLIWTGAGAGPTRAYESYVRAWRAEVPGKPPLEGSSDPVFRGDPAKYNPEDLLVVALASCHLLSYLALCARAGIEVAAYQDAGERHDGDQGRQAALRRGDAGAAGGDRRRRSRAGPALHAQAHADASSPARSTFPVRNRPSRRPCRSGCRLRAAREPAVGQISSRSRRLRCSLRNRRIASAFSRARLLRRLLVVTAHPHLAIQAFALHLLLQRAQRLIDIVVANLNFHRHHLP